MSSRVVIKNRPSKSSVFLNKDDISQKHMKTRSTISQIKPLTTLPSPSLENRLASLHSPSALLEPLKVTEANQLSSSNKLSTVPKANKGFKISRRSTNNVHPLKPSVTSPNIRNSYQIPLNKIPNFEEDKKTNLNLPKNRPKKSFILKRVDPLPSLPDLPANNHCSSSRLPHISIFPPDTSPLDFKFAKEICISPALNIESCSESDSEDIRFYDTETAKIILADFLSTTLEEEVLDCAVKAEKEVINAYLTLSSSKICYNIINEVLETLTPKIVQLAYYEENVAVFTGVRNEILAEIEKDEIGLIVEEFSLVQISLEIMKDYAKLLPIQEIASECIREETLFEFSLSESIYFGLIDCLTSEDWFELLIEDEISQLKIEEIWKMMPLKIVKELKNEKGLFIVGRIAENIWFDFLNDDLSEIWVEIIVKDALCGTNYFEESEIRFKGKKNSIQ